MLWIVLGQVAAVVFTEDLKRLYVTMKEGFPLEYTVSLLHGCYSASSWTVSLEYNFVYRSYIE